MLCITETWLHEGISSGLLDPRSAFCVLRKDRTASPYGRVAVFINRSLCCTEVVLDVVFAPLELLCFDVITEMCKLRFYTVYRPTNNDSAAVNYANYL